MMIYTAEPSNKVCTEGRRYKNEVYEFPASPGAVWSLCMLEGRTTNSCRRIEFWGSRDPLGYGVPKQPEKDKLCSSDWINHPCSSYTREDECSLHWHHIQNKQGCLFSVNRMLPMWKLNLKSKSKQKAKHSSNLWSEVGGGTGNSSARVEIKLAKRSATISYSCFQTKQPAKTTQELLTITQQSWVWTPNPGSSPNVGRVF